MSSLSTRLSHWGGGGRIFWLTTVITTFLRGGQWRGVEPRRRSYRGILYERYVNRPLMRWLLSSSQRVGKGLPWRNNLARNVWFNDGDRFSNISAAAEIARNPHLSSFSQGRLHGPKGGRLFWPSIKVQITLAGLYSPPAKLGSTQFGASSLRPLASVASSEVLVLNLDGKPAKVISSCPMADCLCVH